MSSGNSKSLLGTPKQAIVNHAGVRYLDFRKTLSASYVRAWTDISLTLVVGAALSVVLLWTQNQHPWMAWFTIPVGAVFIGYLMAMLQLFWHEAAHRFLAPNGTLNDLLSNLFIGIWVGQDIASYRKVHFPHHKHHGETGDTERSYFEPLTLRFIVESLTGIHVLRVLRSRETHLGGAGDEETRSRSPMRFLMLAAGLLLNGAIVLVALRTGNWPFAIAWIVGIGSVFPFFASLRQLLEHRSTDASDEIDYREVPHGAVNRMFGAGIVASTFGAAGFNRHLLHHWDPTIPYTALPDVEHFLLNSDWGEELNSTRTTYFAAFKSLYHLS